MSIFKNNNTVHTSRTMMFAELSILMNHAISDDNYLGFLNQNIANKNTKTNQEKTTKYLKGLYVLDINYAPFIAFKYFWQIAGETEKSILALLYAISNDYLLAESIPMVQGTPIGERVLIEKLDKNIEILHPGNYSANTLRSAAQNIASSWKQANFITGKIKNIRTQPEVGYYSVVFAFLMAYFYGERGDFILKSKWVKALALNESAIRLLAVEGAKRDLLQYQYAGNVTAISFNNLFEKLNIHGI